MKKEIKCVWYDDPGHAWLRVPARWLYPFGIHNDISTCSYEHGRYVYLEEDCDAGVFIKKAKELGYVLVFGNKSTDNRSGIRNYAPYNKENYSPSHDDNFDAACYATLTGPVKPLPRRRTI